MNEQKSIELVLTERYPKISPTEINQVKALCEGDVSKALQIYESMQQLNG